MEIASDTRCVCLRLTFLRGNFGHFYPASPGSASAKYKKKETYPPSGGGVERSLRCEAKSWTLFSLFILLLSVAPVPARYRLV